MASSIGGFFATLSLKSDQASFDKSKKNLQEVEGQTKKTGETFGKFVGDVIKGFAAIGGAAVGAAYAVSNIQGKMALTATSAGMGFNELNKWSVAMKLIGQDAGVVSSKMSDVNAALVDYKMGNKTEAYTKLAEDLAKLGNIDINKFKDMSATERIKLVTEKVTSQKDPDMRRAYEDAADDLLGLGGMLMTFRTSGSQYKNLDQLLAQSGKSSAALNGANGLANSQSFNRLMSDLDQTFKLAGERISTILKPALDSVSNWIETHGKEIAAFFDGIGNAIKGLFGFFKSVSDQSTVKVYAGGHPEFSKLSAKIAAQYGIQDPDSTAGGIEAFTALITGQGDAYGKKLEKVREKQVSLINQAEGSKVNLYVHIDKSGNVTLNTVPTGSEYIFAGSSTK